MLELLNQYKQSIQENKRLLSDFQSPPANIPNPEITLSNNDLLIIHLTKIFEEEKSRYLPGNVTSPVSEHVNEILKGIQSLAKEPENQSHFTAIIQRMDKLYACCLQYGLMTFGFSGKEETQMIENAHNAISEITIQTKSLRKAIKTNNEKAESLLVQFDQYVQKLNADSQQKLKDFEENLQTNRATAEANVATIAGMVEVVNGYQNSSKTTSGKITELHTELQQTSERIKEIENQSKSNQQNITTLTAKINEQVQNAANQAADTKAKLESATQALATIQEQKKNILKFYTDIENHKAKMIEVEKAANAKFNELQQNAERSINQMKEETTSVIRTNKVLQGKIQEHLARAVSVSLFKAFGQRQKTLFISRFVWLGVLAATLAFAFLLVQYIVNNVSAGTDMAFFIRLSLAGPLIFAMYFAASQYRKDRQAEEEYAFKSAISISLEPYRDLLKKMREDNAAETEFVQKLMDEVFDNPARYLYRPKESGEEATDMEETPLQELLDFVQKFTGDQVNKKEVVNFIKDSLQKITKTKI